MPVAVEFGAGVGQESVEQPPDLCHGEGDDAGRFVSAVSRWVAWAARAVRKAWASMARVMCRYQPG
jgi:hypothetical protein